MFLKKIELQGFKSFASKTVVEFRGNITAVVGPNGSGKSNIADAIRWVLGEQSPRLLRGKKHHDVIFTGSKLKGRLGMAEVSLYIDNGSGRLALDYPEVVITRRVYQDGDSEYLINKSKVRLADVIMLLARAHFGQKSYAVVGQGMIDKIVNLLPNERKEFFDEAAGVKQYQIKRDQAVNKLIRTEVNLERVQGLIAEVEPRLHSLRRQVKKLARREKIVKDLQGMQIGYYGYLWQEEQGKLSNLRFQQQQLEPQKTVLEEEIAKITQEMQSAAGQKSRGDMYKELQSRYDHLTSNRNEMIKQQVVLESRLELANPQHNAGQLRWLRSRLGILEQEVNRFGTERDQAGTIVADLRGKLDLRVDKQKQIIVSFKEKEYAFLKLKEKIAGGHGLSVPQVREKLSEIYQQQTAFIEKIYKTDSLEEFKKVKAAAKHITLLIADLMDALSEKQNAGSDTLVKHLEQELQHFMLSRDNLVNEISDIRVKISTQEERARILGEHIAQKNSEKEKLSQEIAQLDAAGTRSKDTVAQKQLQELRGKISTADQDIQTVKASLDTFNNEEEAKREQLMRYQSELRNKQDSLSALANRLNELQVGMARLETHLEDMSAEIEREIPDHQNTVKRGRGYERPVIEEVRLEIVRLKKQLELIGGIDPEIVHEHEETEARYKFLTEQYADLSQAIKDLDRIIDTLDVTIRKHFDSSFREINKNFSRYFQTLFGGGQARLSLLQETETEAQENSAAAESGNMVSLSVGRDKKKHKVISGVEIVANPPGKKLNDISVLSGGEKALTAISLIAAIIASNPPPFVALDEVEAALDEANSERFTAIIKQLSQKTQFIIITHNRATMKEADTLYGVTMDHEGVSRLLSVELAQLSDKVIGKPA